MKDRTFFFICFGFILGVLFCSLFVINFYFIILFSIITLALFVFFYLISLNKFGIIFSCFIFAICLGMFCFYRVDNNLIYKFDDSLSQKISFSGVITDEPSIRENNQKLIIKVKDENFKVLVTIGQNFIYKYGDEVSVSGKLEKPENFTTDQGKNFDYINYLRKDSILYVMNFPEIDIVSRGNGNFVKNFLFNIKNKFLEKINKVIPSPESLLLGGIILGEKASFDTELRQDFINTGTIHIVALSGYNITIVAEWFMKIFSFLPRLYATWMGVFSIILFILMTGSSSTAIRAGVMAILALYARQTGRNYDVARILVFTAIVMILFNPFILVFDVSFQLSFIATIALIFFTPKVEKYFMWVPKSFGLREIASITFAVYIFVLPFILYKMGSLSLVALPTNFLVLPFIPFIMAFGFLTGFLGQISYLLSVPFGYISYFLLQYELWIINIFANIPFASLSIPNFPLFLTIFIYMYFMYILFGRSIREFFISPLV